AGIGGAPGAGGVESVAAVTSEVGHGAEDGDGRTAASVGGCGRIKGPGAGAFDGLVRHAGDGRRRVILHRHSLAARARAKVGGYVQKQRESVATNASGTESDGELVC